MWAALVAALLFAPPPDLAAGPSRIVFASKRTAVSQLYSVEPSGEGLAQLTFGPDAWDQPTPSPDGHYVLAQRRPDLWLLRADGSDARLIARNMWDEPVSWSADSRRFVYANHDGEIWSATVAGGPPQQITRGQSSGYFDSVPSLSPDGRSIAFVRSDGRVATLIVRRDGRDRTLLEDPFGAPSWSPDGRWIAIGGTALRLVSPTGRRQRILRVARTTQCPACRHYGALWSPDGRRLAYAVENEIHVMWSSGGGDRVLDTGDLVYGIAWAPAGDAIAFVTEHAVSTVSLDGRRRTVFSFGPYEWQWGGIGWSAADVEMSYRTPEEPPQLVRVTPRELWARYPIRQFSADGDRIAYWLCPHALGAWRPGDARAMPLGLAKLSDCRLPPETSGFGNYVYNLALAGDRLAYLDAVAGNAVHVRVMLTTLAGGTEGTEVAQYAYYREQPVAVADLLGGGSTLVFGARQPAPQYALGPEEVWRIDDAKPVLIAAAYEDLQPLAVDGARIVARVGDDEVELLDASGEILQTFPVAAVGAALDGDDVVLLVQGELRDYSASTGELLEVWPLPDVPSAGRCRVLYCNGLRLTLDDTARGLALYTFDGTVHLLRLRDGTDRTVPGAIAGELTDAGLFYTYPGDEPWPGRIRFVPFAELPL
jgi:Tol biopolymer transport system component